MGGLWAGEVIWNEEKKQLTLEGEPVLAYRLRWPELKGGRGARQISRDYARMAEKWRRRWQRELYWWACMDLARRRAAARPFRAWTAELTGEMTLREGNILSLSWASTECRGDGRPCWVRWGDVWNVWEGSAVSDRQLLNGRRGWKRQALQTIGQQIPAGQAAGAFFPEQDWEKVLHSEVDLADFWLTEEGVWTALPQSTVAVGVEGAPVFCLNQTAG